MDKKFPKQIPVFPLSGVIYFPKTNLPLNVFEKRYLNLVNDTLQKDKLMGMIQLKKQEGQVYQVGCLGKISDFQKSEDGRILINLTGIIRFEVEEEVNNTKLYREFKVDYEKFFMDLDLKTEDINIKILLEKAKIFFKKNGLLLNWKEFEKLEMDQQINTLAMISPLTNEEKQKVLETTTNLEKVSTLTSIIEFYFHETGNGKNSVN